MNDRELSCPECGKRFRGGEDSKFCPLCGAKLESTVFTFCPRCGGHLNQDDSGNWCSCGWREQALFPPLSPHGVSRSQKNLQESSFLHQSHLATPVSITNKSLAFFQLIGGLFMALIGVALCFTVIGIVVGVPLAIFGGWLVGRALTAFSH